ncbi:MAG: hypothetical protein ACFCVD_01615 [Nodosilinea sp.]
MMPTLTLDLTTSAQLLGTEPDLLLNFIQREKLAGVLFFEARPQVSVFTLAGLLNTTPEVLLDWMEDESLANLIEEVDDDAYLDEKDGKLFYQSLLKGEG